MALASCPVSRHPGKPDRRDRHARCGPTRRLIVTSCRITKGIGVEGRVAVPGAARTSRAFDRPAGACHGTPAPRISRRHEESVMTLRASLHMHRARMLIPGGVLLLLLPFLPPVARAQQFDFDGAPIHTSLPMDRHGQGVNPPIKATAKGM